MSDLERQVVDQRQFWSLYIRVKERRTEKLRTMFEKYDSNGDNCLSIDELKRFVEAENCPAARNRLENCSDPVDFEEFCKLNKKHSRIEDNYWTICKAMVPPNATEPEESIIEGENAYESNRKLCPPPLIVLTFTLLQIIFFTIDHIITEGRSNSKKMGPITTLFIFNPRRRYELWRFITYMFVHRGMTHLLTNTVIQISIGLVLETVHRWRRVTLVYLAGVLAGSMGSSLFTPRIRLAGASAGGFALITAQLATIIMNWNEMEYGIIQFFVIVSFLGLEYCYTDVNRISNIAHVSGALAGFLVGIVVLRNLKELPWERKLKRYAITLYVVLMATGVAFHLVNPAYFV